MRFFVTKVDRAKTDEAVTAYQEYMTVRMMRQKAKPNWIWRRCCSIGAADKSMVEFRKYWTRNPITLMRSINRRFRNQRGLWVQMKSKAARGVLFAAICRQGP